MRLFFYYSLHAFKNQVRKLLKTWVLIFLAVCFLMGIAIGLLIVTADVASQPDTPQLPADPGPSFFERQNVTRDELVELAAGAVMLVMFVFCAMNADKNGSRIFLPADVNLLFASPMRPQSVLLFRVASQMGVGLLGGIYMLIQVPNLTVNLGLELWPALSLPVAWGLVVAVGALIQISLYTLAATYPAVKRNLRRGIFLILGAAALTFIIFASRREDGWLRSAVLFFNAPASRYVPFWGWIKGFCACALREDLTGVLLSLLALVLGCAALIFLIWHVKADIYEDAMAKSEETAQLLEAMRSQRSTGAALKRKKDRSDSLRRDGLNRGAGASVFFFKTVYNRSRFAHLGFLTKTMETYLLAALAASLIARFAAHTSSFLPVAFSVGVLVFFRALGNPLEQDTQMDFFRLIPESPWAKLLWSLAGGALGCLLDILPALLLGTLILGSDLLTSLLWVPIIVSVDFYATTVGAFIALSVPVSAGRMLKQVVQISFIYFGLLPDIAAAVLGTVFGRLPMAMVFATGFNLCLGFVFFALTPLFLEPRPGRPREEPRPFTGDLRAARRSFSRLGAGALVMLASSVVLQAAAAFGLERLWPSGAPTWAAWTANFAPLYLISIPLGLLVMRKVPSSRPDARGLRPRGVVCAGLISIFVMYSGNILGTLILLLIRSLLGRTAENPLVSYVMSDSPAARIAVMVILAPLIEEYVFRRTLIDKTRTYGERLAVLTSALVFGLFHGNLSQFFYAFALGLVFGYIYLRTGRLRYSVALHMCINFMGGVIAPAVLSTVDLAAIAATDPSDMEAIRAILASLGPFAFYALALLLLWLAGLVLFFLTLRTVTFRPAPQDLPPGRSLPTAFLNAGMISFTLLCVLSIALTFV